MPTGQPDSMHPYEPPALAGSHVERTIREAMDAGEFDHLSGEGKPIPGAGMRDDDMWWVRSWIDRNRAVDQDESSKLS
jgi:Domain of unknown function (DUF1992)